MFNLKKPRTNTETKNRNNFWSLILKN